MRHITLTQRSRNSWLATSGQCNWIVLGKGLRSFLVRCKESGREITIQQPRVIKQVDSYFAEMLALPINKRWEVYKLLQDPSTDTMDLVLLPLLLEGTVSDNEMVLAEDRTNKLMARLWASLRTPKEV